jgi:hypothetical protein
MDRSHTPHMLLDSGPFHIRSQSRNPLLVLANTRFVGHFPFSLLVPHASASFLAASIQSLLGLLSFSHVDKFSKNDMT